MASLADVRSKKKRLSSSERRQEFITKAIEFFAEHFIADADHSSRQMELVEKLITTDELAARAKYGSLGACLAP